MEQSDSTGGTPFLRCRIRDTQCGDFQQQKCPLSAGYQLVDKHERSVESEEGPQRDEHLQPDKPVIDRRLPTITAKAIGWIAAFGHADSSLTNKEAGKHSLIAPDISVPQHGPRHATALASAIHKHTVASASLPGPYPSTHICSNKVSKALPILHLVIHRLAPSQL